MKAILMSIQPKWCEKIANGEKTIEVRKTRPKLETPFKCYIYCTKGKVFLYKNPNNGELFLDHNGGYRGGDYEDRFLSGKVIGEFVCNEVVTDTAGQVADRFHEEGKLTLDEQRKYGGNKPLYGWHISELKIYDTPKELGEFKTSEEPKLIYHKDGKITAVSPFLTRPPQSYMYVEELEE